MQQSQVFFRPTFKTLGIDRSITKDVKNGPYCCYVRCARFIVRLWGIQIQLITMHSKDYQTKVVQSKGWLYDGVN